MRRPRPYVVYLPGMIGLGLDNCDPESFVPGVSCGDNASGTDGEAERTWSRLYLGSKWPQKPASRQDGTGGADEGIVVTRRRVEIGCRGRQGGKDCRQKGAKV